MTSLRSVNCFISLGANVWCVVASDEFIGRDSQGILFSLASLMAFSMLTTCRDLLPNGEVWFD